MKWPLSTTANSWSLEAKSRTSFLRLSREALNCLLLVALTNISMLTGWEKHLAVQMQRFIGRVLQRSIKYGSPRLRRYRHFSPVPNRRWILNEVQQQHSCRCISTGSSSRIFEQNATKRREVWGGSRYRYIKNIERRVRKSAFFE